MNFTAARHEGEKREVITKKGSICLELKESHLSSQDEATPGCCSLMSSKCGKNLRQGNIKCEWCWKLTKAVGRWGRLLLLMPLFWSHSFFGYLALVPTFTKQASGIALMHSCCDGVYCHYLKWLALVRQCQSEHNLSASMVVQHNSRQRKHAAC